MPSCFYGSKIDRTIPFKKRVPRKLLQVIPTMTNYFDIDSGISSGSWYKYRIWNKIWHPIWHKFWHFFLANYSDILSGILFGIYSDLLCGINSDILTGIYINSGILSRINRIGILLSGLCSGPCAPRLPRTSPWRSKSKSVDTRRQAGRQGSRKDEGRMQGVRKWRKWGSGGVRYTFVKV